MHVKSIVSVVALSAALALSGPAFAQTMFNGAELSAEDLPVVTARCDELVTAADTASLASGETGDAAAVGATDGSDAPVADPVPSATTLDIDNITLEMCKEAGLPAPAM